MKHIAIHFIPLVGAEACHGLPTAPDETDGMRGVPQKTP